MQDISARLRKKFLRRMGFALVLPKRMEFAVTCSIERLSLWVWGLGFAK